MADPQGMFSTIRLRVMATEASGLASTSLNLNGSHRLHRAFIVRFNPSLPRPGSGNRLVAEGVFVLRLLFRLQV